MAAVPMAFSPGAMVCVGPSLVLLSAAVAAGVDRTAGRWLWRRRSSPAQAALVAVVALLACLLVWRLAHPSPASMFARAFGQPPPDGVHLVEGQRYCVGMDFTDVFVFTADADTLRRVLAQRPFEENNEQADRYVAGEISWDDLWVVPQRISGLRRDWRRDAPLTAPRSYWWHGELQSVSLLWDQTNGRAYCISVAH